MLRLWGRDLEMVGGVKMPRSAGSSGIEAMLCAFYMSDDSIAFEKGVVYSGTRRVKG